MATAQTTLPTVFAGSNTGWEASLYAFLAEKQRRSGSNRTPDSYYRTLRHFFGGLHKSPDQVSPQDVFSFAHGIGLSGREPSAVTVGARLSCISSFFKFLIRMDVVRANPCDPVERPKPRPGAPSGLSAPQMQQLLQVIPDTLKRNRAMPRNSCHAYLLRSLIRCAVCGLSFCGTWTRGPRYRCNGSMAHRGPLRGKCIGASIKGEKLETAVWSDVSRFLTNPSDLVDELLAESNDIESRAVAEAERASLIDARSAAQHRRKRAIDLYTRGKLSEVEFDAIAADVEQELKTLDDRLAVLEPDDDSLDDALSEDVLSEIRERLDDDLSEADRQEIVQLLVRRITVHTTLPDQGRKQVRVVIDYRFPRVGEARTGIAASHSYNLRRVIAV